MLRTEGIAVRVRCRTGGRRGRPRRRCPGGGRAGRPQRHRQVDVAQRGHRRRPGAGSLAVDGRRVALGRPGAVRRAGRARTFQTPQTFAELTCIENVLLGDDDRGLTGLAGAWLAAAGHAAPRARALGTGRRRARAGGPGRPRRGVGRPASRTGSSACSSWRGRSSAAPQVAAARRAVGRAQRRRDRRAGPAAAATCATTACRCWSSTTRSTSSTPLCDRVVVLELGRRGRRGRPPTRSGRTSAWSTPTSAWPTRSGADVLEVRRPARSRYGDERRRRRRST